MRPEPVTWIVVAGAVLVLLSFTALFTPVDARLATFAANAGAVLFLFGLGARLARRLRRRTAEPERASWNRPALVLLAASLLAAVILAMAGPTFVYSFPRGDHGGSELAWEGNTWYSIQNPQRGRVAPRYDVHNDTTYLLAGYGHGQLNYAIALRGDHSDLGDRYRIRVTPEPGPAPDGLAPLPPHVARDFGNPTVNLTTRAVFEVRAIAPFVVADIVLATTTGLALGWLQVADLRRAAIVASGALAGSLFSWSQLTAGFGLVHVLVVVPLLLLATILSVLLLVGTRPSSRRRTVALWILMFVGAAVAFFLHLVNAFPSHP